MLRETPKISSEHMYLLGKCSCCVGQKGIEIMTVLVLGNKKILGPLEDEYVKLHSGKISFQ